MGPEIPPMNNMYAIPIKKLLFVLLWLSNWDPQSTKDMKLLKMHEKVNKILIWRIKF